MLRESVEAVTRRVNAAVLELPELTAEQIDRCDAVFSEIAARVPDHWYKESSYGPAGAKWRHNIAMSMTVIVTVGVYDDEVWIHASIAHERRVPEYADLVKLKEEFIGKDRKAIMVFPPADEHVNIHPNALHLFSPVDNDPLPDFTQGSGSL